MLFFFFLVMDYRLGEALMLSVTSIKGSRIIWGQAKDLGPNADNWSISLDIEHAAVGFA